MTSGQSDAAWTERAKALLDEALDEIGNGSEAISEVSEALAALYRAAGEAPHSVVLNARSLLLPEDEPEDVCTCPPGLVERGGYTSSCVAHGRGWPVPLSGQRAADRGVCAAGSCVFCGCTFRRPSDALNHRCVGVQEAEEALRAVEDSRSSRLPPLTGGLLHPPPCPHCRRQP